MSASHDVTLHDISASAPSYFTSGQITFWPPDRIAILDNSESMANNSGRGGGVGRKKIKIE